MLRLWIGGGRDDFGVRVYCKEYGGNMREVRLIQIEEDIQADNRKEAEKVRGRLAESGTFMLNLMSSPGSGKTGLILRTIESLQAMQSPAIEMAVIEADMDSQVDAEAILETGVP